MEESKLPAAPRRLIKLRDVLAATALKRSRVYELAKTGHFPPPIKLGGLRAVAWVKDEVDAWIDTTIATARGRQDQFHRGRQ